MKKEKRERKKKKTREKIKQSGKGRKVIVYRSNKYTSAQIVDIFSGRVLLAVSSRSLAKKGEKLTKTKAAKLVGKGLAEKALKKGIKTVAFDRSGYLYHGRVKALAEGAREGGLKF